MIVSISGVVQKIETKSLTILVGGVGVRVWIPATVLDAVDRVGQSVILHTFLIWRENAIALYGFGSEGELELFELLLAVSGIGPRLALAVISTLSPEVLTAAVLREESAVLQRVPGIGKKTAQRIMFHLGDKLKVDQFGAGISALTDVDTEVIAAMTALGYSVVEAQTAVQRLPRDSSPQLEDRVRLALKILGG